MGLKFNDRIRIDQESNIFNSYANHPENVDNWYFKYITHDTFGDDQTITEKDIETNKDKYPIGTIFLDSKQSSVYLSSDVSNIIIDNTPPETVKENIQYTTFNADHKCSITFESDTLLDIRQISISTGDYIFYQALRKKKSAVINSGISDIAMSKHGNSYELTFVIAKEFPTDILNEHQIIIAIWDVAGNKCIYKTGDLLSDDPIRGGDDDNDPAHWETIIPSDVDDPTDPEELIESIKPLKIEFIDIQPPDMIVSDNIVGKVLVKVTNPNKFLWSYAPTINLVDGSVGYLDKTFDYNKNTGVLQFYITHITKPGYIDIQAWITINNRDEADVIKLKTFVEEILSGWRYAEDCRKYHFDNYIPGYIKGTEYADFVKFCETFLNTSHYSLTTNNNISILEKIARINSFNDISVLEQPLLSHYKNQFGIEITPNISQFIYYLNNIPEVYDVSDD